MSDSKYIIVCCDGTGMDGNIAVPDGASPQASVAYSTNISRIARSLKRRSVKNKRQIVFYQSGVGSETGFNGEPVMGTSLLKALGSSVASKIRDAYVFIAQNYEKGDEIFLFGFSRGAYTARKVSGLIDKIGLLSMKNIGQFFDIWLQLVNGKTPTLPSDTEPASIRAIGVFDTVCSIPVEKINALNITDTTFPSNADVGLHALSFHESRGEYLPTLWTDPEGGLKANQIVKQVWFSGDHSDVGGGWEHHELADISFAWMVGELNLHVPDLSFDAELVHSFHQVNPQPWGTSQPHRLEPPMPIMIKDRREAGLTKKSLLHSSLLVSPISFTPQSVITMKTLFGPPASYPAAMPLNYFEGVCKERWGKKNHIPPPGSYDPDVMVPLGWVSWVKVQIPTDPPPRDAIVGGKDADGLTLYVARVGASPDQKYPGKYNGKMIHAAWLDTEWAFDRGKHDVLIGGGSVLWVSVQGPFGLLKMNGLTPVDGGKSIQGNWLYIAKASLGPGTGTTHPGWVEAGGTAHVSYGGAERVVQDYEVLAYIHTEQRRENQ